MKRRTKEQKRRDELVPVADAFTEALAALCERHRQATGCDDCAAIRTKKDAQDALDAALDNLRPAVIALCEEHKPRDEGEGKATPIPDEDDNLPI